MRIISTLVSISVINLIVHAYMVSLTDEITFFNKLFRIVAHSMMRNNTTHSKMCLVRIHFLYFCLLIENY